MRRICEQHLVSVDQALNSSGGLVEALSEPGDLVATFNLDPRAQVAGSERLDAALESLEPSGEPSDHGTGAESDHERDGAKECREHQRARALPRRYACNQPSAVRKRYRDRRSASRSQPPAGAAAATRSRKRLSRRCQRLVGAAEQREVGADALGQPFDRLLLSLWGRFYGGNELGDDLTRNLELLTERRKRSAEMPKQTCRDDHKDQACHDREIDLKVKPSHPSLPSRRRRDKNAGALIPGPWRKHSPRRGP